MSTSLTDTRTCRTCKTSYPLTPEFFYRNGAMYTGGLDYRCKPCDRERTRWGSILRLYGVTQADYEMLLEAQGGVCAVCKEPPSGKPRYGGKFLDIDHDHVEGHVRGLLCRRCNLMLGYAYEDPELLQALSGYLVRNTRP